MKNIQLELIIAHNHNDLEAIKKIHINLINNRAKMDRWFDKYLDMFDSKFEDLDWKDPAKKLYNKKFEEYQRLNASIKMAEHYLKDQHV